MADSRRKAAQQPEEKQMLFNDPHQEQSFQSTSNFVTKSSKGKSKSCLRKGPRKLPIAPSGMPSSSYSILLEEGQDLPVFWNGENPVPLIKWGPSLVKQNNKQEFFSTIFDFLSTYAAGRYLTKCSISLQCSSTKYINNLKMSDPFSKILDHYNKDGRPVTLLLTHAIGDEEGGGYSKFTLYIRETNGKKILWNGSIATNRMVAKLTQSDMSMTIGSCLQNYVAKGYLTPNCQVDLVKERSDTLGSYREELSPISTDDLVNTLFKGNSASIVIRSSSTGEGGSCNDNDVLQFAVKSLADLSQSSSTKIAVFTTSPVECHWIGMTWGGIKDEVYSLVNSVEITMRDMILPTGTYASILEKKSALVTAIRRRCRVVDEVWLRFRVLRNAYHDLLNGNIEQNSGTALPTATGGDVDNALHRQQQSCIDFLSSSLIRYGMELELYDEETQGLTRMAGVGVGIAVVVAICAVVYYY